MNYYPKVLIASFFFIFLCIEAGHSYIFIYKITTDNKTFITASHLSTDTFLIYNGGKDIVKKIKILDIYDDKDFSKAVNDYNLKPANVREVPHEKAKDNNTDIAPFIWWR